MQIDSKIKLVLRLDGIFTLLMVWHWVHLALKRAAPFSALPSGQVAFIVQNICCKCVQEPPVSHTSCWRSNKESKDKKKQANVQDAAKQFNRNNGGTQRLKR